MPSVAPDTSPQVAQVVSVVNTLFAALAPAADSGADTSCALDPVPQRVIILNPGTSVVADDCCNGQLSARIVSMSPVYRSPRSGRLLCDVLWWDCVVEIKLFRCIATLSTSGIAPAADKIGADGQQFASDMGTMMQAFLAQKRIYSVGEWQAGPNEGGCSSGAWEVTIRVDAQPCY